MKCLSTPPLLQPYRGDYEYTCGRDCTPSFFQQKAHQAIQEKGARCLICGCELILTWQSTDAETFADTAST